YPEMIAIEQALGLGRIERCADGTNRHAGTLRKQVHRNAIGQTQRAQHEFKAELATADLRFLLDRIPKADLLHIGFRLLESRLANHAMRERELGMGAGPNAEVVAELPVIQVVTRLSARLRVSGYLIVLIAGCCRHTLNHVLH